MNTDSQIRRQAIAAALTWKLAAPALRWQAATNSADYAGYRRAVNIINGTVRERVRQARIMGARIAY